MSRIDPNDYIGYGERERGLVRPDFVGELKAKMAPMLEIEMDGGDSERNVLLQEVADDSLKLQRLFKGEYLKTLESVGGSVRMVETVKSERRLSDLNIKLLGYDQFRKWVEKNDFYINEPLDRPYGIDLPMSNYCKIYMIVDLPAPLSKWWNKGVGSWGGKGIDLGGQVLEWGRIYRELCPILWEFLDGHDNFGNVNYIVERLNEYGDHVPGKYYYDGRLGE